MCSIVHGGKTRPVVRPSIHILLVTPVVFDMMKEYELKKHGKIEVYEVSSFVQKKLISELSENSIIPLSI